MIFGTSKKCVGKNTVVCLDFKQSGAGEVHSAPIFDMIEVRPTINHRLDARRVLKIILYRVQKYTGFVYQAVTRNDQSGLFSGVLGVLYQDIAFSGRCTVGPSACNAVLARLSNTVFTHAWVVERCFSKSVFTGVPDQSVSTDNYSPRYILHS